jgi:hypothetical protein
LSNRQALWAARIWWAVCMAALLGAFVADSKIVGLTALGCLVIFTPVLMVCERYFELGGK